MEVVGLIPARGGSRGIERKNLVRLAGKPLIAWTVEAALASRRLARTIVSTDSPEIASVARALGAEVPFMRPGGLARDDTPMSDVVRHALEQLPGCDVLVLLQPTSPLRRSSHIDEAIELLLETGADAVVSVVEVPHQFTPSSLMELRQGRLVPIEPAGPTRRQEKPRLYARNGPAVVVLRPAVVRERGTLYGGDCRAYVMDAQDSVDVDGPLELELAECLLRRER